MDNEIFFNPMTFANENHPETLHQGIEVGGNGELFNKLSLSGAYTYTDATFEEEPFKGNDIPAVPRHKANLGVRIYNVIPGFVLSAEYLYVGDSFAISDQANDFEKLGDAHILNMRLCYEWKTLRVFGSVNNITDAEYSEYAVVGGFPQTLKFYPAPGINWFVGVEIAHDQPG
jgi:iron complex outermembrane receptor protein